MPDGEEEPKPEGAFTFTGIEQQATPQSISIPLSGQPMLSGEVQNFLTGGNQQWDNIAPVEKKPPSFARGILIGFILYIVLLFAFGGINAMFEPSGDEDAYGFHDTSISSENSTFTMVLDLDERVFLDSCNGYLEQGNMSYNLWCSWEDYGDDRRIFYISYCNYNCDDDEPQRDDEKLIGHYYVENTTIWFEEAELANKTINLWYSTINYDLQEKNEAQWQRQDDVSNTLCFVMPLIYIGFTVRAFTKSSAYGFGMLTIAGILSVLPFLFIIAFLMFFGGFY
jgi:hypothetical protein